jgi:hypothetical protein
MQCKKSQRRGVRSVDTLGEREWFSGEHSTDAVRQCIGEERMIMMIVMAEVSR